MEATDVSLFRSSLWILVSTLYISAAIYFQLRHKDQLPSSVPLAYLAFGSAIFFSINSGPGANFFGTTTAEYVTISSLLIGWYFGVRSVQVYIRSVSKYVPDGAHP